MRQLLLLLALFSLSLAIKIHPVHACDLMRYNRCKSTLASCVQSEDANPCECYATHKQCMLDCGCLYGSLETLFVQQCKVACPNPFVCKKAHPEPEPYPSFSPAPEPRDECNTQKAQQCSTKYSTCINRDEMCTCFQEYGVCLKDAHCMKGQMQQAFRSSCRSKCTEAQCSLYPHPPGPQPSEPSPHRCEVGSVAQCISGIHSCRSCGCLSSIGRCVKRHGCMSYFYPTLRTACSALGCRCSWLHEPRHVSFLPLLLSLAMATLFGTFCLAVAVCCHRRIKGRRSTAKAAASGGEASLPPTVDTELSNLPAPTNAYAYAALPMQPPPAAALPMHSATPVLAAPGLPMAPVSVGAQGSVNGPVVQMQPAIPQAYTQTYSALMPAYAAPVPVLVQMPSAPPADK